MNSVTVGNGITLTLQANTVLKFLPLTRLLIDGKVVATGTITNPVVFTSIKQDAHGGDTNLDGYATSPAPGDWVGIYFDDDADDNSVLANVVVEYGGQSACGNGSWWYTGGTCDWYGNINLYRASPTIRNSVIRSGYHRGIIMLESAPTISNNTIRDNNWDGIYYSGSMLPTINNNALIGNGNYSIYVTSNPNAVKGITNNSFSGTPASAHIGVNGGTITMNSTWTNQGVPYVINSSITVADALTPTLTLEPGVVLRFNGLTRLLIGSGLTPGKLMADGTGDPITFTSNAATPAPGDWVGIYFDDGADDSSLLDNTLGTRIK
jgi:parallel beta-helix repeat protein